MKSRCDKRRALSGTGFTVLEVVIAVGIFSLAAMVMIGSVNSGLVALEVTRASRDRVAVLTFAMRQILAITDRETLLEGGDITLPNNEQLSWEADLEPTETLDVHRLVVTLELPPEADASFDAASVVTQSCYVLRSDWYEDPGDRDRLLEDKRLALERRRAFGQ